MLFRALWGLFCAFLVDHSKHWLCQWAFLADDLLGLASFCTLSLGALTTRCLDWLESQEYHDTGEGPFRTYAQATRFAQAEVGLPWRVLYSAGGWRVYVRGAPDE